MNTDQDRRQGIEKEEGATEGKQDKRFWPQMKHGLNTDQDRRRGIGKEEGTTDGRLGPKFWATDETQIEHGLGQEAGNWKRKKDKEFWRQTRQEVRKRFASSFDDPSNSLSCSFPHSCPLS